MVSSGMLCLLNTAQLDHLPVGFFTKYCLRKVHITVSIFSLYSLKCVSWLGLGEILGLWASYFISSFILLLNDHFWGEIWA
jgi:hypothetical protein